jgi:molecular chaperone Hsp33
MTDRLLIGVTRDGQYRGRVASVSDLVRDAVRRHQPSSLAAEALARALAVTAVYPAEWKDCERISIQWTGGGPIKSILTEVRGGGALRGYVREVGASTRCDRAGYRGLAHGLLPGGFLTVLRQDPRGHWSKGEIALTSGEVDEDLEAFCESSDQIHTRLRAVTRLGEDLMPRAAAGILVQALPCPDPVDLPDAVHLEALDPTLPPDELLALALGRPFDLLQEQEMRFQCTCSRERMAHGIALLEVNELLAMINDDEKATVRCDFCGDAHVFDRHDLEDILAMKVTAKPMDAEG